MKIQQIQRVSGRLGDDLRIVALLKNWPTVLVSKLRGVDFDELDFRSGLRLKSPREIRLEMLFHEVWIKQMYSPHGYEVQPGNTVIDIGANIGVFSIFAATRSPEVRVLSFEPFPENANWLQQNVAENGLTNISVHRNAVAGETTKKTLYIADAWVGHSLNKPNEAVKTVEINCVALDEIMNELEVCDLMKIDCEGSEYDIFYSASDSSLSKIKRIVGEFHEIDLDRQNGKALCGYLETKGFTITAFEDFNDSTGSFCATRS